MTTITSSTRPDVRRPSIAAVLLAIAGRIGWRMWWPLAAWLLVAGGARLWLATGPRTAEGDPISYVMLPGTVSLLAIPVMVGIMWFWGARFALALGHARSRVFVLTALSGFVLAAALHLISSAATVLEYRLVGEDGPRVFLTETSGFLGTNTSIINGATVMMAIYGLPLLGILIVTCAGFLGRGIVGGVVGMFGVSDRVGWESDVDRAVLGLGRIGPESGAVRTCRRGFRHRRHDGVGVGSVPFSSRVRSSRDAVCRQGSIHPAWARGRRPDQPRRS